MVRESTEGEGAVMLYALGMALVGALVLGPLAYALWCGFSRPD